MNYLVAIDWEALFRPQMSVLEILLRGTLVYIALCVLLRIILKRQAGKIAMTDLLVVTLVAGVCRNPLVRDAYAITDGLSVVAVLLGWGYLLDWLSYRVQLIHRLLHPEPVVLIQDGIVQHDSLKRELLTESQLRTQLRQQGVAEPSEVTRALLEGSGKISVVCNQKPSSPQIENNGHTWNGDLPSHAETLDLSPAPFPHALDIGDSTPLPPKDPDVDDFLRAACRLREKIAGHERHIAAHREAVAELEGMLAEHGVHMKARKKRRREPADSAEGPSG